MAGDGLVAELLPYRRPDPSTHDSDSQSFVGKVVELAQILTGASGSAIAFRGEQGTICRARSGEGAPPLGAPVDTTSGISKQCLDSGTSLRCEDIATDGRVDPDISQAVGIRAVAVVPIYSNGDISGILEVFSNAPGVFTDQHLKTLQHLANGIGSAANMPSEVPICVSNADVQLKGHPDITLLVALEPAYRAFFGNLADMVSLRSPARLAGSSSQMHGWNDVLVDSHVPWKRFIESVFLHILVVGMLSGLSRIWPPELLVSPPPLREAHVAYYPFSQSFPARGSSRPAVHPIRQDTSAHQEVISAGRDREPLLASDIRGADDVQKVHALTTPPPAMPKFGISRFQEPELGAAVLPPPPDIDEAQARQSHLPDLSVVSPPPDLSGGSGLRKMNAPRTAVVPPSPDVRGSMKSAGLIDTAHLGFGSARAADISIVPPPPSLNDRAAFTYGATGVTSNTGVQVVAPPSSVQDRAKLDARAGAISLGAGVSQVVPPPPSLEGAGNSVGGGRANSLADGGSQVVPPAPSMQNGRNYGGGGRTSSLGQADSQAVPPPPSVQFGAGGNSGAGGRASSLVGARAEGVSPPVSTQGEGNSKLGGARVEKDVDISSVPETGGDRKHPIFQDVQLRVISLTWAPPRSSYFSNFEVFIAEKWLNKKESEFIKLVYEFLPYQQRLSEYRYYDLKVHRLRVARDSTCDESLMQMAWPEGDKGPAGSDHSGDATASISTDRNNALPCYRTTADDYRRAVSRSR
ncbi:MAG: GAF domain-containing protein [Terriglobales bacterium]